MSIKRIIVLVVIGIAGICLILVLFSIFSGVFKHREVEVLKTERIIMPVPKIPDLSEAINSPDSSIRLKSVKHVLVTKDKSQVSYLLKTLKDEDSQVREESALILGELSDKSVVPALKELLNDKDAYVPIAAAYSLAKLEDDSGSGIIKKALRSKDEAIRSKAEKAFEFLKKIKIIRALQKDLKYYQTISKNKKLKPNDRVFVLTKILKKYEEKGIDLSEIKSEIDKLYKEKTEPAR